jgi:hypothetical protein
MSDCFECREKENHIDYLLEIMQLVYDNAHAGLKGDIDNETALDNIIFFIKNYVKEEK